MTTFSQQQGIPVSLYYGTPAVGTTTIDLDDSYDHILTKIAVKNPVTTGGDTVTITDAAGNAIWGCMLAPAASTAPAPVEGGQGIVLQAWTELKIVSNSGYASVSISAYRLAPTAASIFS